MSISWGMGEPVGAYLSRGMGYAVTVVIKGGAYVKPVKIPTRLDKLKELLKILKLLQLVSYIDDIEGIKLKDLIKIYVKTKDKEIKKILKKILKKKQPFYSVEIEKLIEEVKLAIDREATAISLVGEQS